MARPNPQAGSVEARGSAGIQHGGQIRAQDYLGLEMSPPLSNVAPSGWMPQPQMPQYAPVGSSRQSLDMSAFLPDGNAAMSATPGSAHNLYQYYRNSTSSIPVISQDHSQPISGDPYDLYGGHAGAHGSHQQTTQA